MVDSKRLSMAALLAAPAALMAYFAFNAGGFYPAPVAYGAALVCLVLAARSLFGGVLEGLGWPGAIACGLMGLYCLLTLVSQNWSHAPGLATVEFTRALLFGLVLVLFSSLGRSALRLAWVGLFLGYEGDEEASARAFRDAGTTRATRPGATATGTCGSRGATTT